MAFADRLPLIKKIEELRNSKVICYLTSLRPGVPGQMGEDAVRELFDQMLAIPAEKIHPLALGNVERFLSQSRMIARKLLNTHMQNVSDRDIEDIVENLASKLYFHGHPINRIEAEKELRLPIAQNVPP